MKLDLNKVYIKEDVYDISSSLETIFFFSSCLNMKVLIQMFKGDGIELG